MTRHVIAGRMGSADKTAIAAADDEVLTRIDLVAGRRRLDCGIGEAIEELHQLGLIPSEIGVDLIILAAHVYAADTRINRASEAQDNWTREIRLVVPVSKPGKWRAATPILKRMLNFLTGDRWSVGFRGRPKGFESSVATQSKQLVEPGFDGVNLLSGGLDSLIGALDALESGTNPLFISHAGEGATSAAQHQVMTELKKHYKNRTVKRLRVWMAFDRKLVKKVDGEDSTRGRSFLFFALGIFAGSAFGGDFKLLAPENGLIALNVPLDSLRLGALSTRTTHPFYIALWNELLKALGISACVENPYWNQTKGEMVRQCRNPKLLRRLVSLTLSCASPAKSRWLGHANQHCGYCLPCIIRRAAVEAALGSGNDPTAYTIKDLTARTLSTTRAEGQQVRSFQLAVRRLKGHPKLAEVLIHKPGPLHDEGPHLKALAGVYRRGLEEVGELLKGVLTKPA